MDMITQNIKPGFWGVVLGAGLLAIIGFNWGGWVTGGTAVQMAQAAVVDRLVPVCVEQFNADSDKAVKLAELKKADYWKRSDYVVKHGWATMPGAKEADGKVAEGCATRITG